MEQKRFSERTPSQADVLAELHLLWQQAHQLGNNDTESSEIQRIMEECSRGTVTPQDALAQARGIIHSKNER